jgi:hypothetical protein
VGVPFWRILSPACTGKHRLERSPKEIAFPVSVPMKDAVDA